MTILSSLETGFAPRENLLELEDRRNLLEKITDLGISCIREIISRWNRRNNPLKDRAKDLFPQTRDGMTYNSEELPWKKGPSHKLIVFIHGLNSSPLAWTQYIEPLSSDPTTHLFLPHVYKKGYCTLKESAKPILTAINDYLHQYPENPVDLVGHSNGARIVAYLDRKLCSKHKIRTVSIAGPHLGTRITDLIGSTLLNPKMLEEFSYDNAFANHQLSKWQKTTRRAQGTKLFFATADDWRIYPTKTSFPYFPNSSYILLRGESHVTIIDAVREQVLSFLTNPLANP